jgi:hypothetical protein
MSVQHWKKEKTINKNKQHKLELVSELSFVFFIFSVIPLWGISLTCHYVSRSAQAANIDEVGHLPRVAVAKFITRLRTPLTRRPLSHADPSHLPKIANPCHTPKRSADLLTHQDSGAAGEVGVK